MCSVTEPALAASLNGLPDEEVALVCDEMADLVWAVQTDGAMLSIWQPRPTHP